MKNRIARKILSHSLGRRMMKKLNKFYPPYYNEQGHYCTPSRHAYYRIWKAWTVVKRKARKYQEDFRLL